MYSMWGGNAPIVVHCSAHINTQVYQFTVASLRGKPHEHSKHTEQTKHTDNRLSSKSTQGKWGGNATCCAIVQPLIHTIILYKLPTKPWSLIMYLSHCTHILALITLDLSKSVQCYGRILMGLYLILHNIISIQVTCSYAEQMRVKVIAQRW